MKSQSGVSGVAHWYHFVVKKKIKNVRVLDGVSLEDFQKFELTRYSF